MPAGKKASLFRSRPRPAAGLWLAAVLTATAGSCSRPGALPTAPSASAAPELTYVYAPAIAGEHRELVEDALPEAIANLESAMGWTLDHDVTLSLLDSVGPPTATGGNQTITIHGRNPGWVHVGPARRKATIAHELFHLYQQAQGLGGPEWIREGAAEFFAFHSAYVMPGTHSRDEILECNIATALLQPMPPLAGLETATGEFPYSYATVGIHFLLNGDAIAKLNLLRSGGLPLFGRSAEAFYAGFEEYKRSWQAAALADCSG